MNPFKEIILKDGFILHWKNRYDPVTLAVVGIGLAAGGMVMTGQASAQQGKMTQKLEEYNAKIKEREADLANRRAMEQNKILAKEGESISATQKVLLAKGGVLTTSGTPSLLLDQTAADLEADRRRILEDALAGVSTMRSEAYGMRYAGKMAAIRGYNMRTGSYLSAGGSILTGLGSMYSPTPKADVYSNTAKATILRY